MTTTSTLPRTAALPARNTLAIVGAGPIGLEAALVGLDHGFDVHVFERGIVGSHPMGWGQDRKSVV